MPFDAKVFRVLIASPSDVQREREAIPEIIYSWNAVHSRSFQVVLLPVLWETHSVPAMGERPQEMINRQLVRDCDILIGVFWTRLGTHTGVAASGTVEEIEEFRAADRPVMLYFSSVPVAPDSIDQQQYARLTEVRNKLQEQGLVERYSSIDELREKINRHLTATVRRLTEIPATVSSQSERSGAGANSREVDRQLFAEFMSTLPSSGSIRFIDEFNMAGFAFDTKWLQQLYDFHYHWQDAEHEFVDPELEERRAHLWELTNEYVAMIAKNTWPTNAGLQTVPPEWEFEQPERFEEVVSKLHDLAGKIVQTHQELIRMGRRKLLA